MKHNRKKLRQLLFYLILSLLLIQCAPEERVTISNEANSNELKARFISLDELKQIPGVMDKLNSLPNGKNKRLASSSKFDFSVETEQALLVEKGDYQSLSFPVYRDEPSKYLENLFLHPHKNSYLVYLIQYDFDDTDLKNLDEGKPIDGLFEKMKITPLNGFDMDIDLGYTQTTATTWDFEYSGLLYWYEDKCWRINHVAPDLSYFTIIPCPGCPCKPPGSGTGEGSTGYTSVPEVTYAQYDALVDLIGTQGGPSGGSGSTGGGGSGYQPGPGFTTPFNPVKPEDVDPLDPDDEHLYNPNPVIGVVSPNRPKFNSDEKNCDELKKMTKILPNNGNEIRNALISLQSAATNSSLKDEKGFSLEHSSTGQTLTPQALETSTTSSGDAVKIKYGGKFYGALHDHPFPNPGDPDKHVPMFSVTDIFYFGYIALKYDNGGQPKDYSKFVLTLTVSGGSEGASTSTYALKIENWLEFSSNFMTAYYGMSKKEKENFGQKLAYKYTKLSENTPSSGPMDYMNVLFKFMDNNNIKGIAIYKASDDLTQWSKQVYNSVDNTITSTPCP